jgi:hypothetical protein
MLHQRLCIPRYHAPFNSFKIKNTDPTGFSDLDTSVEEEGHADAVESHQDVLNEERKQHVNTDKMNKRSQIITKMVDKCHHAATVLKTSYSVIISPKFAADKGMMKTKAGGGGLAKEWKSRIARMRHGGHRSKLVKKVGMEGKVIVGPSEACSSMKCSDCSTLHHPGRHWLHHCPRKDCKKVTVRDECGREISNLADTRILVERDHKLNRSGSNGHQDPTRSTVVSA